MEPAERASESAVRASEPAGRASEAAGRAPEAAGRASEPAGGRRTDGRMDGRTDRPSYRDARTHLKR